VSVARIALENGVMLLRCERELAELRRDAKVRVVPIAPQRRGAAITP
jgi:hypothetical protein